MTKAMQLKLVYSILFLSLSEPAYAQTQPTLDSASCLFGTATSRDTTDTEQAVTIDNSIFKNMYMYQSETETQKTVIGCRKGMVLIAVADPTSKTPCTLKLSCEAPGTDPSITNFIKQTNQ